MAGARPGHFASSLRVVPPKAGTHLSELAEAWIPAFAGMTSEGMRFPSPLIPATLVKRYKRFLADVVLPSGEIVTAHCANPGSMIGLMPQGALRAA